LTGEHDSQVTSDKKVHHGEVYLGNLRNRILEIALGAGIVSELKCCKRCGAFTTCTNKGECCPECEWFDPIDNVCMAVPLKKAKPQKEEMNAGLESDDVDPDTFLFEDDDEDDDLSDLPPERDSDDDDDDFGFDDDDDDW
jgi:hypothetical protein